MFIFKVFANRLFTGVSVSMSMGLLLAAGCGGSMSNCTPTGLMVGPSSATISHTATPPSNSQTFSATLQVNQSQAQNGCVTSALSVLVNSNWTANNPAVQLSGSPSGQVTATCSATVATPVTITATQVGGGMLTGQAMLTCN